MFVFTEQSNVLGTKLPWGAMTFRINPKIQRQIQKDKKREWFVKDGNTTVYDTQGWFTRVCRCCFCRPVGAARCQSCCKEIQDMSSCSLTNIKNCVKREWCLSDLLSSNLLPLRLKRLRIHIASDRLERDTAPPAAKPEAVAAMLAFGAVESELYV